MSITSFERQALPLTGPMTHSQLELGIKATNQFFSEGDYWAGEIVGEIQDINENLQQVPGFKGTFGLGYPFYAIAAGTGHIAEVPAIREHVDKAQVSVVESMASKGEEWPCATCQETRGLPDLKTECKPCDKVLFKPRDLFKALPDIDIVTVFDLTGPDTEHQVQQVLADMDLVQSDTDIRGAFNRTVGTMLGTKNHKLPLDAHIWDANAFSAHCELLQEKPYELDNVIEGRSLHTHWEDHPINFWFDFVFSMTEVGEIDSALQETVFQTRKVLYEQLGEDGLVTLVGKVSIRGKAILEDPMMEKIFRERVNAWQNL